MARRRSPKRLHGLGMAPLSNRSKGVLYGTGIGLLASLGIWFFLFRDVPPSKSGKAPGFDEGTGQ